MAGTLQDVRSTQSEDNYTGLTTNATAQIIQEVNVGPLEGGYIEVYATGITPLGGLVTGIKYARFKKDSTGVLTLAVTTVLATTADTEISTANFNLVISNNNVGIQATGVAGKNIGWNFFMIQSAASMINF